MITFTVIDNPDITSPKIMYFVESKKDVSTRSAIVEWFTISQRLLLTGIPKEFIGQPIMKMYGSKGELYPFRNSKTLFMDTKDTSYEYSVKLTDSSPDYIVYGIIHHDDHLDLYLLTADSNLAPFNMSDKFQLEDGMIDNYTGKPTITDIGKFYLNQLLLVEPFGDLIPYINERLDPGKTDAIVAKLSLEKIVTREMYNKYMKNGYWYGNDGSIATQTWSLKALSTDPNIAKRKKELLEKYKDSLNDPTVLSKIESELIQMDIDYMKGDVSEPFFATTGTSTFKEQRKKMFVTNGLMVTFDKTTNNYVFIEESLSEGWAKDNIDIMSNDIRRGIYGRSKETADGGAETKLNTRIFQDVKVTEEDCGVKTGLMVLITEDTKYQYLDRWLTNGTLISEKELNSFINKVVEIRAPQKCKTTDGFCYKCIGEKFRKLEMKAVGINTLIISSSFMNTAMKSQHISGINTSTISDINKYIRNVERI